MGLTPHSEWCFTWSRPSSGSSLASLSMALSVYLAPAMRAIEKHTAPSGRPAASWTPSTVQDAASLRQ